MSPEEKRQLEELVAFKKSLESASNIPFNVDRAFRFRLRGLANNLEVSSKAADSEDQTVNESGSSSYSVLSDPVGFLSIEIEGTTYNLPYY